ncbi:MAG: KEOPS complex subunit Cgi121 [Thermoplasmatota archaeon]
MVSTLRFHTYETGPGWDHRRIAEVAARGPFSADIVVLDPGKLFDPQHLGSALMHAARALLRGQARARDRSIEVLRWLSGAHQVSRGLEVMGPDGDSSQLIMVELPPEWPVEEDSLRFPILEPASSSPDINGLTRVEGPSYGGIAALAGLGITDLGDENLNRAQVLEIVCLGPIN